jgi:hypothetical protein
MRQLAVLICLVGIPLWSGIGWAATITVTTTESGINEDGLFEPLKPWEALP